MSVAKSGRITVIAMVDLHLLIVCTTHNRSLQARSDRGDVQMVSEYYGRMNGGSGAWFRQAARGVFMTTRQSYRPQAGDIVSINGHFVGDVPRMGEILE